MIFSTDGGQSWIAPAKDHGFLVDHCYGYGKAMELPVAELVEERYQKFRSFGHYLEKQPAVADQGA